MTILTDGIHLVSTVNQPELHAFAQGMGLKREWFQPHPRHPHYDLTTTRAAARAFSRGAWWTALRDIIRHCCPGEQP